MNIKVSDFGLARVLEEGKDYYRMGQTGALPIRWMAPESIADFLFTTESDIVSNGVTNLYCRAQPDQPDQSSP
jgi:hypothetical protein